MAFSTKAAAVAALVLAFVHACPARAANDAHKDLGQCRSVADDAARLDCYDREVARIAAPRWQGRLSHVTEHFTIAGPARLRFQSDGVIFVLYLKDDRGEVVQNLHIGGGGESTYLIEQPGTYFLQINGSEGWRIWLEQRLADESPNG